MAESPGQEVEPTPTALALRALAGFAALALALGTALFLPAGTFDYWQAWLYLLAFLAPAAVITLYLWRADRHLLEGRVSAGPLAERQLVQMLIPPVAALAFLSLMVMPGLDHRFGWSNVPAPLSIVADLVVAAGFYIVFLVFRENTFTAATIRVVGEQRVISTGPYAVVRHPMYAGAVLTLLATPVALGSWWGLLAFVPMLAVIVWRLRAEEQFLREHLPGYAEYCARVRYRLVPLSW